MLDIINTDPYLLFGGCFFLVMGLSIFFAGPAWQEYMSLLSKSKALLLIGGVVNLPIGLFILMFYNKWDGIAEVILMVVGILALIKSLALLAKPDMVQKLLSDKKLSLKPFWIHGVISLVVGIALIVL